jgi:hypothetical protein
VQQRLQFLQPMNSVDPVGPDWTAQSLAASAGLRRRSREWSTRRTLTVQGNENYSVSELPVTNARRPASDWARTSPWTGGAPSPELGHSGLATRTWPWTGNSTEGQSGLFINCQVGHCLIYITKCNWAYVQWQCYIKNEQYVNSKT